MGTAIPSVTYSLIKQMQEENLGQGGLTAEQDTIARNITSNAYTGMLFSPRFTDTRSDSPCWFLGAADTVSRIPETTSTQVNQPRNMASDDGNYPSVRSRDGTLP